ncbi:MAG: hypothetical protein JST12_08885 [Armatimonadetes bacterium]|nr:hypothetical protein [Armatimonadota bacterium]
MAIFTTVVNMDNLVNRIRFIEDEVQGSELKFDLDSDQIVVRCSDLKKRFQLIRLHRPHAQEILDTASDEAILVLSGLSQRAAEVAQQVNHIEIPSGSYRIIAPGIAVQSKVRTKIVEARKNRLQGLSGTIVETLLTSSREYWSIHELASESGTSTALAHRVLERLESEQLVWSSGSGRFKTRKVLNKGSLAELWAEEEKSPKNLTKGYFYIADTENFIRELLSKFINVGLTGAHAANTYQPFLTRVNAPARIWIPYDFAMHQLTGYHISQVEEGHNVEILQSPDDPWCRWSENKIVSPWRAWVDISKSSGRTQELAQMLLKGLIR